MSIDHISPPELQREPDVPMVADEASQLHSLFDTLDQLLLQRFGSVNLVIIVLNTLFFVGDFFIIEWPVVLPIVVHEGVIMVGLIGLHVLLIKGRIPARWANLLITSIALMIGSNVLLTLSLTHDSFNTLYLMMIIIGAASLLMSRTLLTITTSLLAVSWLVIALQVIPADQIGEQVIGMVVGIMLAVVIQTAQASTHRKLEIAHRDAGRELDYRHRTEIALRESEGIFLTLSQQTLIAIAIIQEGEVKYANQGFEFLFGISSKDVVALSADDVQELLHPPSSTKEVYHSTKHSSICQGHTWTGQPLWIDMWSGEVEYQGQPATLSLFLDISESVEAQQEHIQLSNQLHQARRLEAVGRLAGGLAHDLNNLLSPIVAYSDIALMELPTNAPLRDDIAEIRHIALRASRLTSNLLAMSRKELLKITNLDLNELIQSDQKMLRQLVREDISLQYDLEQKLPSLCGDESQLEQVLINLTINAQDALPEGGTIWIRTYTTYVDRDSPPPRPQMKTGEWLTLSVQDDGVGVDPEVLDMIFEPFFTTKVGSGTGLGLATVYGIVQQHQGVVNVDSEVGKGTTFHIYLPINTVEPSSDKPQETPSKPTQRLENNGMNRTVLIVDDEPAILRMIMITLRKQGFNVLNAGHSDEAIRLASEASDVDLLLSDVIMPGRSGPELYKILLKSNPDMRVLFMSGYVDDITDRHTIIQDGHHFLAKPFLITTLSQAVHDALGD